MGAEEEFGEVQNNPEIESKDGLIETESKDGFRLCDNQSTSDCEFSLKNLEIQMNNGEETGLTQEYLGSDSQTEEFSEDQNNFKSPEESENTHTNPETDSQDSPKESNFSTDFSSPRGVLEISVLGSDTDNSTSSSTNSSSSSSSAQEKLIKQEEATNLVPESHKLLWRKFIQNIKKKSVRRFSSLPLLINSSEITRKHSNRKLARIRSAEDEIDMGLPQGLKPSWKNFNYEELAIATDNFSPDKLIGKGGHAEVYKGCLVGGEIVAVKRLMKKDKEGKEEEIRIGDFLTELGIIAHVNHPNAAHLIGFGVEGGLHLVLQLSPHGSLASFLHGSENTLDWSIRYKVAVGVAEGLNHLHKGCHRRIIHRDIKASNILLTQDYEPQISDFGLAKWLPDKWTHHIVYPIEGTFGYLAPEYFMHGIVDEKTDVFAFGVLLLELITGRRAIDSSRQSLVIWAKPLLETKKILELVDPRLGEDYMLGEMKNVMLVASMCIHHVSTMRPLMSRVVQILKGEREVMAREEESLVGKGGLLFDACALDDYTSSTYLNDLNRHKQLALE